MHTRTWACRVPVEEEEEVPPKEVRGEPYPARETRAPQGPTAILVYGVYGGLFKHGSHPLPLRRARTRERTAKCTCALHQLLEKMNGIKKWS